MSPAVKTVPMIASSKLAVASSLLPLVAISPAPTKTGLLADGVAVAVRVGVEVRVTVGVGVLVAVDVGVLVAVETGVAVGPTVDVRVGVGVQTFAPCLWQATGLLFATKSLLDTLIVSISPSKAATKTAVFLIGGLLPATYVRLGCLDLSVAAPFNPALIEVPSSCIDDD